MYMETLSKGHFMEYIPPKATVGHIVNLLNTGTRYNNKIQYNDKKPSLKRW